MAVEVTHDGQPLFPLFTGIPFFGMGDTLLDSVHVTDMYNRDV
jgi:hypothetical protein